VEVFALNEWIARLQDLVQFEQEILARSLLTIAGLLVLWLLREGALRIRLRRVEDVRVRYQWQKSTLYVYYALLVILLGTLWVRDLTNTATYLGLLSAGLAIALRDPVVNIVGWFFLVWRRPFEVGDRIQIGILAGDVIDLRIFQFTLMEIGNWVHADQSTGRVVHVPNGKVFTDNVANYSKGISYIWNEIPVVITFESDWRKGKELLAEIAGEHAAHLSPDAEENLKKVSRKFMLYYGALTPIVYTSVKDHGVQLTVRYLCRPHERRGSAQAIWEAVLDAFAEDPQLEFAYPTTRFYNAALEHNPQPKP
jgi:small-conductance mechanosensitive channel